ncbi:hypothetical protein ACROYT_G036015, partial [Oculina patagonica]
MTLLELNIGQNDSLTRISLVYSQSHYYIKLKQNSSIHQLRLERTTSFNEWTRVAMSVNQTNGVLKYSENRVIIAEMLIEKGVLNISWSSVAIGQSHSLADIGFMKSFAVRKLQITRFGARDDSIHNNIEMELNQRFGSEQCEYEKIDIPDTRHHRTGCSIASYPATCSETLGSTDTVVDHKQRRSVRLDKKSNWMSPYISDMYGCLSLWCRSDLTIVHVYVKPVTGEEEYITYRYIKNKQWVEVDEIRLKSFTHGPYQIRLYVHWPAWFDVDSVKLSAGNCQSGPMLEAGFGNTFLHNFPRLTDYLHKYLLGVGYDWRLCYNATADGWEPQVFHSKCDHKPLTVF